MTRLRSYTELSRLETLEERYAYLRLSGRVGEQTFGSDRYINQEFYRSRQWKQIRDEVIIRDGGSDLGVEGFEIYRSPVIHHINPMSLDDLVGGLEEILDPEFLITTTLRTHNAIHYGDESQLPRVFVARQPGDTKLW